MKLNNLIYIKKILLIMFVLIISNNKVAYAKMEMFCEGLQAQYEINDKNSNNVSDRIKIKAKFTKNKWVKFNGQGFNPNYKRSCKLSKRKVFCSYDNRNNSLSALIDFDKKFLKIFDSGETKTFECFVL